MLFVVCRVNLFIQVASSTIELFAMNTCNNYSNSVSIYKIKNDAIRKQCRLKRSIKYLQYQKTKLQNLQVRSKREKSSIMNRISNL